MRHDTAFVQCRLPIDQDPVARANVAKDFFDADRLRARVGCEKLVSKSLAFRLIRTQFLQISKFILKSATKKSRNLDVSGARMAGGSVHNKISEIRDVPRRDRLWVRETKGKHFGDSDLVRSNHGIGGNDRSKG